ncbi:C40 family peptidase [Streptomyces sp. NE06-03E]|uniref:C40 family peptidase n=1 Tax=unclassified Streptomyces TaxID=2593676 RepID=UPI000F550FFF|nr:MULTISPECIES: C40 family peptidase [unclassified Streptomyces]MDX3060409.1 C40 family peptidase [Streptomyces sp. NE06-03E]RPK50738.1 putative endopeptidase precursor [Streptomyces sp. ADI93-02]WSS78204.1 C40 family peptidase [Streptomyces sp. NBC_01174]
MSRRFARTLCTAALAAVVAASPAVAEPSGPPPAPGPAAGAPQSVAGLLKQLQTLYRQAEEAGEVYNGTEVELRKRTAEARKVHAELARARAALGAGRRDAGRLARDQYQGRTDFSVYMQLLLSDDPSRALEQSHVIERAQAGRSAVVDRLTGAEKHAEVLEAKSRKAREQQRLLAARQKQQRDTVQTRLKGIEAMLASLSAEQLAAVAALEEKNIGAAQDALTASGALSSVRPPTEEGGAAVRYAVEQIGKPYVWGAEGPDSYDCSGLTSQAWSAAGRDIPRTSQEQWAELPKVPIGSLRPGDLVVYFPKATHVALYIGNGLVVQAPRPGATVKVSPLASNPLLGAVRPDPDGEPLGAYTLPELPEGATSGADTGYDAQGAPEE